MIAAGTGPVESDEDFQPGELQPCPFCGAGENRLDISRHWTGMRFQPISYALRHWCVKQNGVIGCHLEFRGKTREAAIRQWNTRDNKETASDQA